MADENKIEIPNPPSILLKAGKEKYYSIAEMLIEEGKWKAGDEIALLALCMNYQRWIQAEKEIKKFKALTFKTDSGYRQQIPEISIANNAMANMLSYIREFALTPRERSKLKEYVLQNTDDPEMVAMIIT
ncbi:P27 family phage terminase small subunit [uncultured Clostridium sp.]|uniref:P27 family phage terminase small subunit n=1 Tax=uncultured Clostridium sp. TaxID=59620 RepID=UPI0028E302C3|nr:P27 family phage terminase small subunit [uncultured Clostridium sp.]